MNDLQAIIRLKWGDIRALDALVERYQVRATRTAYLVTQDAALASDVVQDAFLSAYRAIGGFDLRRPFAPWFMRTVVNGAIKASRRDQSHYSLDDFTDDAAVPEPLIDAALDEVIAAAQTEQAIWEALAQLSPERRAVIVLRFYLDLSEIDMAHQLDIPVGTVKSRLHAAKRQLRDLLYAGLREE
ncbi:MAG: sigma-70 family RNA polymerase sigma factor [Anaerolineae bacterium]